MLPSITYGLPTDLLEKPAVREVIGGLTLTWVFLAPVCVIRIPYAYCTHTILGVPSMGRKVRKTLNIDAAKLEQAREYLKLDTETEVIDRLLDDLVWERRLLEVLRSAPKSFKTFRSPLTTHPPPHLSRPRRR